MRGTATGYAVAGRAASSSARWETMMMKKAYQAARAASARPRPRPQRRDFRPRSRLGAALAQTHEGSRSRAYAYEGSSCFFMWFGKFRRKVANLLANKAPNVDLKKTRGSSAHASPVQPCVSWLPPVFLIRKIQYVSTTCVVTLPRNSSPSVNAVHFRVCAFVFHNL
jgi:hypothetical protein